MIPPHVYKEAEDAMPAVFMPRVQLKFCAMLYDGLYQCEGSHMSPVEMATGAAGLLADSRRTHHTREKQTANGTYSNSTRSITRSIGTFATQLPSIRNIPGMWYSVYRQMDNDEVKDTFNKLLQVKGQDYKKVNAALLKNIVLTNCGIAKNCGGCTAHPRLVSWPPPKPTWNISPVVRLQHSARLPDNTSSSLVLDERHYPGCRSLIIKVAYPRPKGP